MAEITNTQPTLPAEGQYTEMERLFIDEQPRRILPTNQNSNFGAVRKVITDPLQECFETLRELALEMFIETASGYISLWERDLGLPPNTATLTLDQRKARILNRIRKQPFTKARRKEVIDNYIISIQGNSVQLTPAGVPLTADGVPLYSDPIPAGVDPYTITENVENFSYNVTFNESLDINVQDVARDLASITPAGINFTIGSGGTSTERAAVVTWGELETP